MTEARICCRGGQGLPVGCIASIHPARCGPFSIPSNPPGARGMGGAGPGQGGAGQGWPGPGGASIIVTSRIICSSYRATQQCHRATAPRPPVAAATTITPAWLRGNQRRAIPGAGWATRSTRIRRETRVISISVHLAALARPAHTTTHEPPTRAPHDAPAISCDGADPPLAFHSSPNSECFYLF